MTKLSAGPWVLVVGMHRSGTSAVAGAIGALGLNFSRSDDRMEWPESNPEHWESLSVGLHNEGLLNALGGSWDAPPDLVRHWEHDAWILGGGDSGALMAWAYPTPGPAVWKDPRVCLLLSHWRRVLPDPIAAVLVWRTPTAVAHSLQKRDGMPLPVGLALWERYNRSAVEGLRGVDTYVVDYDTITSDPTGFVEGCADWLGSMGQFEDTRARWDLVRAAESIASELHHQPAEFPGDEVLVSSEQRQLGACLAEIAGEHRPLAQELSWRETPWSTAIIGASRAGSRGTQAIVAAKQRFWAARARLAEANADLVRANHELDDLRRQLDETQRAVADLIDQLSNLKQSTSWRITKPLRSSASMAERFGHRRSGP